MKIAYLFLGFTLCFFVSCKRGPAPSANSSKINSLESLSAYVGVAPESFVEFFKNQKDPALSFNTFHDDCFNNFTDTNDARSRFIVCLASTGPRAFNEELYAKLHELRVEKYQAQYKNNNHESVALLSYLEDLTRAHIWEQGRFANWYDSEARKFLQQKHYSDFPFENGDILLSIGGTSISTLIPMVTKPRRRYSHAFMMRKSGPRLSTVEAIIEKGVVTNSFQEFSSHPLNGLLVMRITNDLSYGAKLREDIRNRAVEIASSVIGAPYNTAMNLEDTSSFFCSQLVGWAYSSAANELLFQNGLYPEKIGIRHLIPMFGKIYDEATFGFLNIIGVQQREMASPGDIMASPFFDIVADYRDASSLVSFWTRMLSTYHFISLLSDGYTVDPEKTSLSRAAWKVGRAYDWYQNNIQELGLLPDALSGKAASFLLAYDFNIYKATVKSALESFGEIPFTQIAPWEILDQIKRHMQNDKDNKIIHVK